MTANDMAEDEKKPDSPVAEIQKVSGTVEKLGCACLNLGCLLIVLGIIAVIAGLLDVFTMDGLSKAAGYVWKSAKNAILKITE